LGDVGVNLGDLAECRGRPDLLARRPDALTLGEFEQPFANLLVRDTQPRINLGFRFGNRARFSFFVDLVENRFRLVIELLASMSCLIT
jgi:hypothetical protein